MREIKFRAWSKDNKKMYPSSNRKDVYFEPDVIDLVCGKSNKVKLYEWDSASDYYEEVILMQYTGLKDKNGKEIYEGDILFYEDECAYVFPPPEENIKNYWVMKWEKDIDCVGFSTRGIEFAEVIGNIYENPGLIKQ